MAKVEATKGMVQCKCNKCGDKVLVPTAVFYAPKIPAKFRSIVVAAEKKVVSGEVIPDVHRETHIPAKQLTHRDVEPKANCDGTFSTIPLNKPKTHKASKDRKRRSWGKG